MSCSTCGWTGAGGHDDPADCVTVLLNVRNELLAEVAHAKRRRDQALGVMQAMADGMEEITTITRAALAEVRR